MGLPTFDFLFLQGTQALEMHRLFFESSLPASFLLLRPFFEGASTGAGESSMADFEVSRRYRMWGMAGRFDSCQACYQRGINQPPEEIVCRGSRRRLQGSTWLAKQMKTIATAQDWVALGW